MEKFFTKTRVLIYIIIGLLLLNGATIGTIFYKTSKLPNFENEKRIGKAWHKGDFMREKLKFSNSQSLQYDIVYENFRTEGRRIIDSLKTVRVEMIRQLTATEPDTFSIMQLNHLLGTLHIDLKKNMINYYFNLKNICTPSQHELLKEIFIEIIEADGMPGKPKGKGKGKGEHNKYNPAPPAP